MNPKTNSKESVDVAGAFLFLTAVIVLALFLNK
jgi:hypothetical protein